MDADNPKFSISSILVNLSSSFISLPPRKAVWWFQWFLFSSLGKWSTLTNIFSNGLKPPTTYILTLSIYQGVCQQKSSSRLQMTNRKQWPKTRRGTGWGSIPEVCDLRLTLTGLLAWYLVPFVCWCVCVFLNFQYVRMYCRYFYICSRIKCVSIYYILISAYIDAQKPMVDLLFSGGDLNFPFYESVFATIGHLGSGWMHILIYF